MEGERGLQGEQGQQVFEAKPDHRASKAHRDRKATRVFPGHRDCWRERHERPRCWDTNGNGSLDRLEDTNGDGLASTADCAGREDPLAVTEAHAQSLTGPIQGERH